MSDSDGRPTSCSQCSTPAISGLAFCVEHLLKFQEANYLQAAMLVSMQNAINQDLNAATAGILPPVHSYLPPPPFHGDELTLNNLNITDSTVGVVNLGQAQNIDSVITMMHSDGQAEVAEALTAFTEAVVKSEELKQELREEVLELVVTLAAQTRIEPGKRSKFNSTLIERVGTAVSGAVVVLNLWERLKPLITKAVEG